MTKMNETVYGSKYAETKNASTTEIAKLFRADVKAAIAKGELPKGLKLSVKTEYYAGGSSITVKIVNVPGMVIINPAYVKWERENPHAVAPYGLGFHTEEAVALEKKLHAMLFAYNYDGSDSMTDYYHVRFSGSVDYDWQYEKAAKDAEIKLLDEVEAELAKAKETLAAPCEDTECCNPNCATVDAALNTEGPAEDWAMGL